MATRDFAVRTEPHVATLGALGELHSCRRSSGTSSSTATRRCRTRTSLGGEEDLGKMDRARCARRTAGCGSSSRG
ncbi:hypothetical protein ACR6C2_07535 [Streptomyces sp. INA 01156]